MTENYLLQEESLHNFYSKTPHIIFEIGLTAFQIAVYCAIKRTTGDGGICTRSKKSLASQAGICKRLIPKVIQSLCEINPILKKSLLICLKRDSEHGDNDTNMITVVDIWKENNAHLGGGAPHAPPHAPHAPPSASNAPGVVHHMHQGGAPHAPPLIMYEEEPLKKNQSKKTTTTPTPPSIVHNSGGSSSSFFNQEKKEAEGLHKALVNWFFVPQWLREDKSGHYDQNPQQHYRKPQWIISIKTLENLCHEYGTSYVDAQAQYMKKSQIKFYERKKGAAEIEDAEGYLIAACNKNYAKSTKKE